jgi:hypothetical protein
MKVLVSSKRYVRYGWRGGSKMSAKSLDRVLKNSAIYKVGETDETF